MHCSLNLLGEASWSYWAVELSFSAAFTDYTIMTKYAHHAVVVKKIEEFKYFTWHLTHQVGISFLKVYVSYLSRKENGSLTHKLG